MRVLAATPSPHHPAQVADLNSPDSDVGGEQVPVLQRAQIEEGVPGHCGVSRDASMASRASSCSASWRRRSSAKRKSRIKTPHMAQPAKFQRKAVIMDGAMLPPSPKTGEGCWVRHQRMDI